MDTETFVAMKCPPEMLPLPGFGLAPQIDRGGCPFADSAQSANAGPHGVAQSARTTRTDGKSARDGTADEFETRSPSATYPAGASGRQM